MNQIKYIIALCFLMFISCKPEIPVRPEKAKALPKVIDTPIEKSETVKTKPSSPVKKTKKKTTTTRRPSKPKLNTGPVLHKATNILVPGGFKIIDHDPSAGEVLRVSYNDELLIDVSESMSKVIKESSLFGPGAMKQVFEARFPLYLKKYEGENQSEQDYFYVNEHIYLYQSFDYGVEGYFEYGALHTKEPEEYYEFFISGSKANQTSHRSIIKSFLEGIR